MLFDRDDSNQLSGRPRLERVVRLIAPDLSEDFVDHVLVGLPITITIKLKLEVAAWKRRQGKKIRRVRQGNSLDREARDRRGEQPKSQCNP